MKSRIKGFTLIELILVIVIMGIISVVVGNVLTQSFKTYLTAQNISETDWQGLLALNMVTNDVHRIRSANDIGTISSTAFSFVDIANNTISYQLSGTSLLRNGLTVATKVSNLAFTFYNKNYVITTNPTDVRYIAFSISLFQNGLTQVFSTLIATRGMP